jgi:imidazole glycerol phosphate synthase subunit HisF
MSKLVKIMPCLDMQNGRVVKGVHFVDIADAGDPVECARAYCAAGADELALLDITATVENRGTLLDVVKRVSQACSVPFTVGGGISDVASAAKAVTEFAKENEKLEVKGGMMDNAFVNADEIKAIASLPSKDVLLAQIAGAISGVARGLAVSINGIPSGLARSIQQVADQKSAA